MDALKNLLENEIDFAGPLFWGSLIVVALWEVIAPLRAHAYSLIVRWMNNIGLAALNLFLMRFAVGLLTFNLALLAEARGWGLLQIIQPLPWIAFVLGVLWLDIFSYIIHVILHRVPILWRLHRLHHSDLDLDFTSARRNHPIEVLLVQLLTAFAVLAMGVPPLSLLLWWMVMSVLPLFQHGNIGLPAGLDHLLRWVIVTPGMHWVHHSAIRAESDRNYGQFLPWWDRLFGTYLDQPEGGHEGMTIGLKDFRDPKHLKLHWMLANPFIGPDSEPTTQIPDRLAPSGE
ncbi:MAG: sterol desaturase family protein [Gammaproteobacteria bacterium]